MTRDSFQQQMRSLDHELVRMADLAAAMLADGLAALEANDADKAETVVARTAALAEADEAIENAALRLLMLQSPVARDLRHVGMVLKWITYINRVGRYGFDIARIVVDLKGASVEKPIAVRQMGRNVSRMMDLVVSAFKANQAPDTTALMELEDEVDKQRYSVMRELLSYAAEDPKRIEGCVQGMMVARYLERCGDNVVKMAEKLHYAVQGERILLR